MSNLTNAVLPVPLTAAAVAAALVPILGGCTTSARPVPADAGAHWPAFMGNAARAPFLSQEISAEPPQVIWSVSVGRGIRGMPIVTDDAILVGTTDRHVQALSRHDGSVYWRRRLDGPPVSLLISGDRVFIATEGEGTVRTLGLSRGNSLYARELPSVPVPPALAGDTLYVATETGALLAIDTRREDEIWRTRVPRRPVSGPLPVDGWVVYAAADSMYVLDRFGGRRLAARAVSEPLAGEPAADDGRVFVTTEAGSLIARDLPNLDIAWTTSGLDPFAAGPVIADGFGYAVSRSGQVLRFDTGDGATRIIARIDDSVIAAPTVVRDGLVVGTLGGRVHFLRRDGSRVWSVELAGAIDAPIFVHESRIVVAMYGRADGDLGSESARGVVLELR